MPATPQPQATRLNNGSLVMLVIIHSQAFTSGPSNAARGVNSKAIVTSFKVFIPLFYPRVKQWNNTVIFWIYACREIIATSVAAMASKR